jgi:uncharacterized protein YegJ (DUF2314 family)
LTKLLPTVLLLFAMLASFGCDKSANDKALDRGVVNVKDDDPEMNAAIKTAQQTFPFFEENWQTMKNDGCSLKFAIPSSDGGEEHIWFSPTKIEGDKITGECGNDPLLVPGLKLGDVRTVNRSDISDWMIMVGNKCYGGYTIRVLAKQHPEAAPPFEYVDPPKD